MKRIGLSLFSVNVAVVILAATYFAFGQPTDFPVRPAPNSGTPILQVQHAQFASEPRGNVVRWLPAPVETTDRASSEPALPRTFSLTPLRAIGNAANGNSVNNGNVNNVNNSNSGNSGGNSGLLLASMPAAEFDSPQRNNVAFASPVVAGEGAFVAFDTAGNTAGSTAAPPAGEQPAVAPTFPQSQTFPQPPAFPQPMPVANEIPAGLPASGQLGAPANTLPANTLPVFQLKNAATNNTPPPATMPPQAPVVTARPVAQNAVTLNHRLRLQPQVFERNLIEKLGSRFVPVRNVADNPGIAQFRLPARDGTDIELTINRQQGIVSVTGTPGTVDASLRIVQLIDVIEGAGRPVARFVPVQQSNIEATRRIANIVNQETLRVAQAPPRVAAGPLPPGLDEETLTAAGVVGPVQIEIIDAFGTVIIQGTPEDVAIIQGMLRQIETMSLENEPVIELVAMRHADSLRVSTWAQQLYLQYYQVRRGVVVMMPLVKPNTILLIGRQESIDAAKELIAKLDTPVNPNAAFRIFQLQHAAAQDIQTTINNAFNSRQGTGLYLAPYVSVIGDLRTNALIVQASPRDMQEVEAMIRELDVPGGKPFVIVRRFPLKNSMATELASVLTTALNASITSSRPAMIEGTDAQGNPLRGSVMYNVTITSESRGNSLIVTAPVDTMVLIETLIAQLDQLPTAESRIRVFTLANGDASTLATLLTNLFGTTTAATGTGAGQLTAMRPGFEEGDSTLVGARFQAETRTNSIIGIGSTTDLELAEAILLRLDEENLNNRTVFTMKLINTPADEIAPILNSYFTTERTFLVQNQATYLPLSPQEQYRMETNVIAEPITNSLIISTTSRSYEVIRRIIQTLDERPLMVAIDVLIAEVDITRNKDRGIEFGLRDSILFNTSQGTPPNPLNIATGTVPFVRTSTGTVGSQGITSLGMGATNPNSGVGGFSFAASGEAVSIFIRALETQSRTQVLARPRLVTLHNRQAQIQVGIDIPFAGETSMSGSGILTTTPDWRQTGTILDVTPRIMPDGMVAMAVYIERSSLGDPVVIDANTTLASVKNTNASTTISAMDGQTVIFAGLISEEKTSVNNSVPGLNKIPVIKHFFEYDSKTYRRTELVIILTPRIIRTQEDMMILNQQERERMSWCVSDVVRMTGDCGIRLRSDEWLPSEVHHIHGAPVILHESQLPPDHRIPAPMFPVLETR